MKVVLDLVCRPTFSHVSGNGQFHPKIYICCCIFGVELSLIMENV